MKDSQSHRCADAQERSPQGEWVLVPREPTPEMIARIILFQVAHDDPSEADYARAGAVLELLPPTGHPDGRKVVAETFRDYRAMLSASPASPAEPGWQPISSAPRDGTPILVAGWDHEMGQPFNARSCWWSDAWEAWVVREGFDGATKLAASQITHWMPLPTPPVEAPTPAHAELSPGNSSDLRGEEG